MVAQDIPVFVAAGHGKPERGLACQTEPLPSGDESSPPEAMEMIQNFRSWASQPECAGAGFRFTFLPNARHALCWLFPEENRYRCIVRY
jgi:hypothetical protein